MKKHIILAVALFGLLALATLAQGDSGSNGGHNGGSDSSMGSSMGGSVDSRSGRSDSSSFSGNSDRSSSDRSSHSVDRWGGYMGSDSHYWWNGGYWEGGCYGCGRWICERCNYPSCPPCQWYNHERRECEVTESCSGQGVEPVQFAGRKLQDSGSNSGGSGMSSDLSSGSGRSGESGSLFGGNRSGSSDSSSFTGSSDRSSRSVDRWGGYWNSDNRYWWNGGYWEGGCYGCGRWICESCSYPSCPPCQWFNHQRWECEYTEACSSEGYVGRKMLTV